MAKLCVELVDGRKFEYNDDLKEIYRIENTDGTITLKLEDCPEIVFKKNKQSLLRKSVYDVYVIRVQNPDVFFTKMKDVKLNVARQYPYLDVYIEPCIKNNIVDKFIDSDLLYDDEYGCQSFFMYLVGVDLAKKSNIDSERLSYYIKNLRGELSATSLQGFMNNPTVDTDTFGPLPLIDDVANAANGAGIKHRTFGTKYHIPMIKKTAEKYKFDFKHTFNY